MFCPGLVLEVLDLKGRNGTFKLLVLAAEQAAKKAMDQRGCEKRVNRKALARGEKLLSGLASSWLNH